MLTPQMVPDGCSSAANFNNLHAVEMPMKRRVGRVEKSLSCTQKRLQSLPNSHLLFTVCEPTEITLIN